MSEWELFLLISPLLLVFIVFFSFPANGKESVKDLIIPPGRSGLPLIGETISFMKPHSSASLGEFLDEHIKMYGKIFRMNLLGKNTVVSADPELNRFILQNEGRAFEASCPKSITEIMGKWSMLALVGDVHRDMRSIAVNFMSNAKLRTYFLPDVDVQALRILNSWKDQSVFSAMEEGKKFAFNLMVKHMMNMDPGIPDTERLRREYVTFMEGMASIPLNLPGTAYRRALKSRSVILRIMGKQLDERIKSLKNGGSTFEEDDLLSIVSREKDLTREQILDLMISMLFAGHETSSAAISLAIYFLQACPEAVQQLREEHLRILKAKKEKGETGLNWDDYKQMEFTHCVTSETIRLGNIVKFLHRRAIKDVQYKGFDIPCGWEVVPIISAAHLDPSLYEDPQAFNPWRWKNSGTTTASKNALMSFSGGPRLCPGAELAKMEVALFLHHLVLKYEWELAEPDHPVSFPFLGFPQHLPIKIRSVNLHL